MPRAPRNSKLYSRGAPPASPMEAVPLNVLEAQTEVLDAAFAVEHAYTVGGGWTVPISINLRRLQTAVRNLKALDSSVPL